MFDNMQVTLSLSEIEKIIQDSVKKQLPEFEVTSVNFDIGVQYDFRNEPYGHSLNKAVVSIKRK